MAHLERSTIKNMAKGKFLFLALVIAFPLHILDAAQGASFGVGAYPLSETVVSMWLLRTNPDAKPLPVLLVYFTGVPNWHNRAWESKFEGNIKQESRTNYRLVSKDVTLEIAVSDDKKTVWIQGKEFKLEENNVYVVKGADKGPKMEVVQALGIFELPFSSDEPLAALVLRKQPELKEKLK